MKNREIKFRAWDKNEKRLWFDVQDAYDWQIMNESNDGDGVPATTFGEILEDRNFVVMQYTGLKDRGGEGQDVYEGDLFNCIYHRDGCTHHVWEVVYDNKSTGFVLKRHGEPCHQKHVRQKLIDVVWGEKGKTIGNIYENPDLLK